MRGLKIFALLAAMVLGTMAIAPASPSEAWGTGVIATYSCAYGKVTTTFVWTGNSPNAYVQAVHLSYNDNGWQPGTYTSSDGLLPSTNTMSWGGLNAGTRHFLRFAEWYPDGSWDASLTFRFDTPWCGADGFTPTFLTLVPTTADTLNPGHTNGNTPGEATATGTSTAEATRLHALRLN